MAFGRMTVVILLHGLSDNRLGMIGYAELLLAHGFAVLMPDARAHGASGGDLATYGLLESDDIHEWFDWLDLRNSRHELRNIRSFSELGRRPGCLGNSKTPYPGMSIGCY